MGVNSSRRKNVVLVDMDGVLADFERGFGQRFNRLLENSKQKNHTYYDDNRGVFVIEGKDMERQTFDVALDLERVLGSSFYVDGRNISTVEWAHSVYNSDGFFENLPPVPGAAKALTDLESHPNVKAVFICTTPWKSFDGCVAEKFRWAEKFLDNDTVDWKSRIITTRDKTVISGDILIDDKVDIKGVQLPDWTHVLFAYNKNLSEKRPVMKGWQDLKSIVFPLLVYDPDVPALFGK